jgi:hypothetical protein
MAKQRAFSPETSLYPTDRSFLEAGGYEVAGAWTGSRFAAMRFWKFVR